MWVHDSQAYRKMNVTRERISRILELREIIIIIIIIIIMMMMMMIKHFFRAQFPEKILLSFETGFNLVSAAVCAILKSISCLEPSSVISKPRYLKLVIVSSFCLFT